MIEAVTQLAAQFRERAQDVDQGDAPPRSHLQKLAQAGYYDFVTRAQPGERRRTLDILSSGCGVTAFVSSQHEGVCRRLKEADHRLLEKAVTGENWFGVCFAHLRRDPSPVEAIEQRTGVVFSGSGPWFTGYGVMDMMLVGGATQGGDFLMGLSPVDLPEVRVRELAPLAVMEATSTVGLDFNALQVENKDIIVRTNAPGLAEKDKHSTVFQAARSLGAARAASEFLPQTARLEVTHKLEEHHCAMDAWDARPVWNQATELRRVALRLAARVVEAAFVNVGGRAHSLEHPLQRISREASFYATTQLTGELKTALTEDLVDSLKKNPVTK
jgi:alkylation response protein AidB-like acyl-CoA dehydrogenase